MNCDVEFNPIRGSKGKYCSVDCDKNHKRKIMEQKILDTNGEGISKRCLRNFLIQTRGQKCELCGISEWVGKPLVVIMDHIDGHHENNSLENLRLICSNCDTTLPTYKSKNKGNGRYYRRIRYANEKSY